MLSVLQVTFVREIILNCARREKSVKQELNTQNCSARFFTFSPGTGELVGVIHVWAVSHHQRLHIQPVLPGM